MRIALDLCPLCLLTSRLESRGEILVLVGVSCHSPRISEYNSCINEPASCLNFKEIEMRNIQSLGNYCKEGQEPFKLHSLFPKCLHKCLLIFGKALRPNQK